MATSATRIPDASPRQIRWLPACPFPPEYNNDDTDVSAQSWRLAALFVSGTSLQQGRTPGYLSMSHQKCPVCRDRKPKRSCPALQQTICTICCATKRLVEIKCPADCVYLSSAKAHPPAVVQRRQDRDVGFLLPLVSDLTETQYRLVVLFQSVVVKHAEHAVPPVLDVDVAEGAAAAAATLETSRKGIIYQHQAVSVPAQRLTDEFARVVADLMTQNASQPSRVERDSAAALRKIEAGARTAAAALADDEAPVYLRLLGRVFAGAGGAAPQDDAPRSGSIITAP